MKKEISWIISGHFQNEFQFLNRLKTEYVIGQKLKCSGWRHLGLTANLKYQLKEISDIISRYFHSIFSYLNWMKTVKFTY
jgi:hypothetical protein